MKQIGHFHCRNFEKDRCENVKKKPHLCTLKYIHSCVLVLVNNTFRTVLTLKSLWKLELKGKFNGGYCGIAN